MILIAAALMMSCGGKKKDAAYYELLVDSIRRAEQVKEMERAAGIEQRAAHADFLDTLQLYSLPIRSADNNPEWTTLFTPVPTHLNSRFGYAADAQLRAVSLPRHHGHRVFMMAEVTDSLNPSLYLFTASSTHRVLDVLCIYEQKQEDHGDDHGFSYTDYYVTSQYEITLMQYFKSYRSVPPELYQSRRYTIADDGHFEEQPIEINN